jgi:hypothetical protein
MKISQLPLQNFRCDFIRILFFDDLVKLMHIKNGKVMRNLQCDLSDMNEVVVFLRNNSKISVELIIANKTMLCRSVPANLSRTDIRNLSTVDTRSNATNAALYESNLFKKRGSIALCNMQLSSQTIDAMKCILESNNHFLGVTCWPIWVISSYFDAFPEDKNKFSTSVFTVEDEGRWEIIVLHDNKYVCYRHGSDEYFDKDAEVANTIKHVSQICKIDPGSVAIYSINESTIASFTDRSDFYMNILLDNINFNAIKISQTLQRLLNVSCLLLLTILPWTLISDVVNTVELSTKIEESRRELGSIDQTVLSEIELWKKVGPSLPFKKHDFHAELQKCIEDSDVQLLRKASLTIDESSDRIIVNIVPKASTSN